MKLKRLTPRLDIWGYIQPHKITSRLFRANDRNLYQGDCGFFVSTEIWLKPIAPIFPNGIFIYRSFCRMIGIFISCGFLFALFWDKPIFIHSKPLPRCRSPPAPFDFSHFKKSNGGKPHERQARNR
jgi:hypothetical protein